MGLCTFFHLVLHYTPMQEHKNVKEEIVMLILFSELTQKCVLLSNSSRYQLCHLYWYCYQWSIKSPFSMPARDCGLNFWRVCVADASCIYSIAWEKWLEMWTFLSEEGRINKSCSTVGFSTLHGETVDAETPTDGLDKKWPHPTSAEK